MKVLPVAPSKSEEKLDVSYAASESTRVTPEIVNQNQGELLSSCASASTHPTAPGAHEDYAPPEARQKGNSIMCPNKGVEIISKSLKSCPRPEDHGNNCAALVGQRIRLWYGPQLTCALVMELSTLMILRTVFKRFHMILEKQNF
ncbi:sister chromatid cohesion protein PDS5-like protein A isoform X2 [Iris pallida]|uniref:Sister chromatid cohesion protein PDS5-like protein A isoform X2 n=1 Tax=Iris pallida TaxID=29817 RepID=A0AAX6HZB9_IRIPA|nr:sister chromatid cohesion protein PDS5-like protein A isoform X2 [Iris pallida]